MTLKTVLFLLLKGALCGLGEEIQTQNCNIYNIHKRMIRTKTFFSVMKTKRAQLFRLFKHQNVQCRSLSPQWNVSPKTK